MTTLELKKAVLPLSIDSKAGKPVVKGRSASGMASTGSLDLGGDVVLPQAFAGWLRKWKASGAVLPILDSHDVHSSITKVVGKVTDAKITDEGLWIAFDIIDTPTGDEVLARIKGGYVTGLSIGYRALKVRDPSRAEQLAGVWRFIEEIDLREVSVVIYPMNPEAQITDVRSGALLPTDPKRLDAEQYLATSSKRMGVGPNDPTRRRLERQLERMRRRTDPMFNL